MKSWQMFRALAREQLRDLTPVAALIVLATVLLFHVTTPASPAAQTQSSGVQRNLTLLMLFPLLWAVQVWARLPPSRRAFFWSLPLHRWQYDMARVAAGAVAVFAGMSLMLLTAWCVQLIPQAGSEIIRLADVTVAAGAIVVYLIASVVTVRSERPAFHLLIAFGVYAVIFAAVVSLDFTGADQAAAAMQALQDGPYGLTVAASGISTSPGGVSHQPLQWVLAFVIWLIASGTALFIVTSRRSDA